jgi:hypothetical protein
MRSLKAIFVSLIILADVILPQSIWSDNFQRGSAIYRKLPYIPDEENVWHSALFSHFEIFNFKNIRAARFVYYEIDNNVWSDATKKKMIGNIMYIPLAGWLVVGPSFENNSQLSGFKEYFKNYFQDGNGFRGCYNNPNIRSNLEVVSDILSTGNAFSAQSDIWYTAADMIDKKGDKDWKANLAGWMMFVAMLWLNIAMKKIKSMSQEAVFTLVLMVISILILITT